MQPILSVQNLTKIYPGKSTYLALDHISFELGEGEILGLLGPNGSGKTTTIQMLLGTLSVTSGTISYFGKNFLDHPSEILQSVSFASTYASLPFLLTVQENLSVFGRFYGLKPKESIQRYTPLLERFGIIDKLQKRISTLSAGQITRLMLVKAFFVKPKVILLDEPTASLDPDVSQEICDFILEQRASEGLSILFTSHKMEEATKLCDRVIFLKKGKIIANDLPEKLAKSASSFRLILSFPQDIKKVIDLAKQQNISFKSDHKVIELLLQEEEIPSFLKQLTEKNLLYTHIKIEEPSLEDYFLQIAR